MMARSSGEEVLMFGPFLARPGAAGRREADFSRQPSARDLVLVERAGDR
jgi:hypothetical protein